MRKIYKEIVNNTKKKYQQDEDRKLIEEVLQEPYKVLSARNPRYLTYCISYQRRPGKTTWWLYFRQVSMVPCHLLTQEKKSMEK